jgi:8-oxo-dGTP diphosphatase
MARRDSAFAVIIRRDQVLVVKPRESRKWQLPGGGIKPGESPWLAALREVREETGLAARLLGLTGIYHRRDGSLAFVFAARVGWQKVPQGELYEIAKRRWMPTRKAMRRLPPSSRDRLAEALRHAHLYRSNPVVRLERQALRFSIG